MSPEEIDHRNYRHAHAGLHLIRGGVTLVDPRAIAFPVPLTGLARRSGAFSHVAAKSPRPTDRRAESEPRRLSVFRHGLSRSRQRRRTRDREGNPGNPERSCPPLQDGEILVDEAERVPARRGVPAGEIVPANAPPTRRCLTGVQLSNIEAIMVVREGRDAIHEPERVFCWSRRGARPVPAGSGDAAGDLAERTRTINVIAPLPRAGAGTMINIDR